MLVINMFLRSRSEVTNIYAHFYAPNNKSTLKDKTMGQSNNLTI